jgi:hypothetical protein
MQPKVKGRSAKVKGQKQKAFALQLDLYYFLEIDHLLRAKWAVQWISHAC